MAEMKPEDYVGRTVYTLYGFRRGKILSESVNDVGNIAYASVELDEPNAKGDTVERWHPVDFKLA